MTKRRLFFQNEANVSLQKAYKKWIFSFPHSVTYQHPVREDKLFWQKDVFSSKMRPMLAFRKAIKREFFLFPHSVPYQHPISEDKKIDKKTSFLPKWGQRWPTESLYKGDFSFPHSVTYQHKVVTKRRLLFQNDANVGLQKGYKKGFFLFPHSVPYQHPINEDKKIWQKDVFSSKNEANVGLQKA